MPSATMERPTFETIPMDRGVTLHFRRSDAFKTDLVRVFFRAPLKGPRAARQIYAALLSRGTSTLPDRRILTRRLQELYGAGYGVMVQRLAGRHVLAFRASTVAGRYLPGRPRNLEQILVLVASALEGPPLKDGRIDEEVFEQERRNLAREYRARLNNKTRYAAQRLFEEMFPGHPIGVPDTGTEEEISSVTPSKCVEEGMRIVREGEADIFVLAPCTASRAERLVRRAFVIPPRAFERFRLENLGEVRRPHRTVREQMDVAQAKLALGFRLVRWRPGEARYVAALADTVLGSGPASKLFRNVRECRSLCYDVRSHLDAVTGTLTIGAGIDPRSFGPAVQAIQDEVLAMAKGRITEDEVGTARASILSALEEVEDTQSGLADFFYIRRLLGRPERSLSEVAAGVVKTQAGRIPKLMARAALDTVFFLDRGGQMSASDGAS